MALEPIVYHGMGQCFRLFAVASYDFASAFNIVRMNGYAPLIAFDPGADAVPYASIFHKDIFAPWIVHRHFNAVSVSHFDATEWAPSTAS